jgi:hypothetical protein
MSKMSKQLEHVVTEIIKCENRFADDRPLAYLALDAITAITGAVVHYGFEDGRPPKRHDNLTECVWRAGTALVCMIEICKRTKFNPHHISHDVTGDPTSSNEKLVMALITHIAKLAEFGEDPPRVALTLAFDYLYTFISRMPEVLEMLSQFNARVIDSGCTGNRHKILQLYMKGVTYGV